jgi:NitT/TauT family transport system substrate-binding protein
VAKEKGFFEEEGLDVELFQFTNSGEGLNAIQAGKLDAGSFGTAAPLTFISKGSDFTIFGGQQTEGHALVTQPEKAEEFKDLKNYTGKTIATVRLSTGDVVFRGALAQAGIDWKTELTISELESPAAVLEAVKKGSVDAGIVWTPYVEMAKTQELEAVTYSGDLLKSHPCCRQVALSSSIKENPEKYEKFMTALIKAYDFYKTNQDETVDIISKYVQIDKELIKAETYGGHIFSIPDPNKEGVIEFWSFMNDIGYITSDVQIENHINTDIYQNALDGLLTENPDNETVQQLRADFNQ